MEKCKCCNDNNAVKYSKYSNGDFCSRKCARAFSTKEKRNEINESVRIKLTKLRPIKIKKELVDGEMKKINEKRKVKERLDVMSAEYSTLCFERLKRRIVIEQNYCCNNCNLSEWLDTPIPLELEHIDGNHSNNERSNVEALCPNCHSLTPTWRGRNKKNYNRNRIDDKTLLTALLENNFNMRQALISVGLAAKGGNYNRCHKLKQEYEEIHKG